MRSAGTVLLALLMLTTGCRSQTSWRKTLANETADVDAVAARVDNPKVDIIPIALASAPITVQDTVRLEQLNYRDVSLSEVITIAMQNSDVLREIGGALLRNPELIATRFNPAIWETDPRFSSEAALSAFDAQLAATAYFTNKDQPFNNPYFAGGVTLPTALREQMNDYTVELSKRTVTGSKMSLRNVNNYDWSNAPSNVYPSYWNSYTEGELRQPLLQGGGLEFNRIAGPGAAPGVYNGMLIARTNMDISQTDFEISVRDYVSNVANAYWDLYFAYRDLDARVRAMNRSLEAWNRVKAKAENDLESEGRLALASEQYYRFKDDVLDALTGRIVQGTQNRNGSTGGTVRASSGVQVLERRLRFLIGIPINENEMLRPSDEPEEMEVVFDWNTVMNEALSRRPELRRQQLRYHKRQMELLAAKNYLNPQLDAVGRYRYRGFGDTLMGGGAGFGPDGSAVDNMFTGDHQEWYMGLEYTVPIGYRKAYLAVNNAELMCSRERAILRDQEREVVHDLSNALSDAARAYESCENSFRRLQAATLILDSYETQERNDLDVDIDRMLDAQRRVVEAEIHNYRARVEYAVAIKNVHLEKGSLMAYNNLQVFDGRNPVVRETEEKAEGDL